MHSLSKRQLLVVGVGALATAAAALILVKRPLARPGDSLPTIGASAPLGSTEPALNPAAIPSSENGAALGKPYEFSDCEARGHTFGEWKPRREEILAAAVTLSASLCYGYWEFDQRRIAATFTRCSAEARSATIGFQIVQPNGGCSLTFRTASWEKRRWIWVYSAYAWGGQIGDQIDILEVHGARLVPYASRWQCSATRENAITATTPPSESPETQISRELRGDWSTFPPELRGFFCEGKLTAENLNDP